MGSALFDELVLRVESLLLAYRQVCAENRRLQEQVQHLTGQQQLVRSRVDSLIVRLEGLENP